MQKGHVCGVEISSAVVRRDIIMILVYSAIKMSAKLPALNSILNPETSSDSPSGRSKGVRLVSARTVAIHIIVMGGFRSARGIKDWLVAAEKSKLVWRMRK